MNANDVKREILLHANLIHPDEAMTKEYAQMSVHQTVGTAFSCAREGDRAWMACQIGYALARYLDAALEQS